MSDLVPQPTEVGQHAIKPPGERFWSRVLRDSDDACWIWTGTRHGRGYGYFSVRGKKYLAHRWAYQTLVGPVPEGLQLDHLCRNRLCVNPAHLEPVTRKENILRGVSPAAQAARKTHCPKGHPYGGENLRIRSNGCRECVECGRQRDRDRYEQRYGRQAA